MTDNQFRAYFWRMVLGAEFLVALAAAWALGWLA